MDLIEIRKKYKTLVVAPYKIKLAHAKIEEVLHILPSILEYIRKDNYYLIDLDIMQDFVGIFNKAEMIDYLTTNYNFCYSNEYIEGYNRIVDNDHTVGIDCLTLVEIEYTG